jgi:hypothetical protein
MSTASARTTVPARRSGGIGPRKSISLAIGGLLAVVALTGCSSAAIPPATPALPTATSPTSAIVASVEVVQKDAAPPKVGQNVLWPVVGFRNTSTTQAAVFTPKYQIETSKGAVVATPNEAIFLFPGETRYPSALVASGTVIKSADATVGAVTWLAPKGGLPAVTGTGTVGYDALRYQSFSESCKATAARTLTGCTWTNDSPFAVDVIGTADICVQVGDRAYTLRQLAPSADDVSTVVPPHQSVFVPVPDDVQGQITGTCVTPDLIIPVKQSAFE